MAGKTDPENSLDRSFHGCDLLTEYHYCSFDLFACFFFFFVFFVLFFFLERSPILGPVYMEKSCPG